MSSIACCDCGTIIVSNPANRCIPCLKSRHDITAGIQRTAILNYCSGCDRVLVPPAKWVSADRDSKELLGICLSRIRKLDTVRLTDAKFIWTEPHSRRIEVKLIVEAEIFTGLVLSQSLVIEYILQSLHCSSCHRIASKDYWQALVQSSHSRTLRHLEMILQKHWHRFNVIRTKAVQNGLDFFFARAQSASLFVNYITNVCACRRSESYQLRSHDVHSNTYNTKTTYTIELPGVSKGDVVCLPKKTSQKLANIGPLCIVQKVAEQIHLLDPQTAQLARLDGKAFFLHPFQTLCSSKQYQTFFVTDTNLMKEQDVRRLRGNGKGPFSEKHAISDVYIMRAEDLGMTTEEVHCRSHLGHVLHPGDLAMGMDFRSCNVNCLDFDLLSQDTIPDIVLVGKIPNGPSRADATSLPGDDVSIVTQADEDGMDRFIKEFEKGLVVEMDKAADEPTSSGCNEPCTSNLPALEGMEID